MGNPSIPYRAIMINLLLRINDSKYRYLDESKQLNDIPECDIENFVKAELENCDSKYYFYYLAGCSVIDEIINIYHKGSNDMLNASIGSLEMFEHLIGLNED